MKALPIFSTSWNDCRELGLATRQKNKMKEVYSDPWLYHVAFSVSTREEVDSLIEIAGRQNLHIRTVLEAASGTGRIASEFAARGYICSGYDVSNEMVDYSLAANERSSARTKAKFFQ